MPARLEWRYALGGEHDMLAGRWIAEASSAPFAPGQIDSVHAAMLRRLSAMGVVHPTPQRSYCLLLPRVHHTENGRAVLHIAGAQLPRWPTGFDAQAWPSWTGRCVGTVRGRETVPITCEVSQDVPRKEQSKWYDKLRQPRPPARAARSDRDPVNVWLVWSPQRRDSTAVVVHGDPSGSSLVITPAQFGSDAGAPRPSPYTGRSDVPDRFVAFLLGGVGTRPRAPLTLCFHSCARRYVLEPRIHTLEPHFRFGVASLRDVSRTPRGRLQLRVLSTPCPMAWCRSS